jgi:hypothetical protein
MHVLYYEPTSSKAKRVTCLNTQSCCSMIYLESPVEPVSELKEQLNAEGQRQHNCHYHNATVLCHEVHHFLGKP